VLAVCEYFYYNEVQECKGRAGWISRRNFAELLMAADYLNSRFLSFWTVVCLEWLLSERLQRELFFANPGRRGLLRYDVMMYDSVL
jgi:hypothetical protein